MTLWLLLRNFASWTSAHGIPHIVTSKSKYLRIFWGTVVLSAAVAAVILVARLVDDYFSFNVNVDTKLRFEERDFPAVTICNLNVFLKSEMDQVPGLKEMNEAYEKRLDALSDGPSLEADDAWGFSEATTTAQLQQLAREHLTLMATQAHAGQNNSNEIRDNFIISCTIDGKACNISHDFEQYYDPSFGFCLTFNHRQPPSYRSQRAGSKFGLQLIVRSEQEEFLDLTDSAGVRVAIHNQTEEPFPDAFGYNAATGFVTSFGIKYVRTERLESPYSKCLSDEDAIPGQLHNYKNYSVEACVRTCLQKFIIEKCGCRDARLCPIPSTSPCNRTEMDCLRNATSKSSFDPFNQCHCPQRCIDWNYDATISTAAWPALKYNLPAKCPGEAKCLEWFQENTIGLNLFYEHMNYLLLSEKEATLFHELLSNMGGQLGLCLGFSVITFFEFFFFAALIVIFYYKKHRNKSRVQGSEMDAMAAKGNTTPKEIDLELKSQN